MGKRMANTTVDHLWTGRTKRDGTKVLDAATERKNELAAFAAMQAGRPLKPPGRR
jgi:hypothetical protein